MTTAIEYALMAGASYISTRSEINQFPVPDGWLEVVDERRTLPSGFEATYFANGTEIVISFAGTDPGDIGGDVVRPAQTSRRLLFAGEGQRTGWRDHQLHRPLAGRRSCLVDGGPVQRKRLHLRPGPVPERSADVQHR